MRDKIYISQFPDGGAWEREEERERSKEIIWKGKAGKD